MNKGIMKWVVLCFVLSCLVLSSLVVHRFHFNSDYAALSGMLSILFVFIAW